MNRKFVNIFFTRRDRLLADIRHTILLDGKFQPMPVHGSRFRQTVFENYTHPLALLHLNRRSWAAPVVAPCIDGLERHDLFLHRLGSELENLYAAVHFMRQIADVRRNHRLEPAGCRGHRMRHMFGLFPFWLSRAQRLAQAEQSRTQHRRILKKSPSRTAHACLLNFHQREAYLPERKTRNISETSCNHRGILWPTAHSRSNVPRDPATGFSEGDTQIRRTLVR